MLVSCIVYYYHREDSERPIAAQLFADKELASQASPPDHVPESHHKELSCFEDESTQLRAHFEL